MTSIWNALVTDKSMVSIWEPLSEFVRGSYSQCIASIFFKQMLVAPCFFYQGIKDDHGKIYWTLKNVNYLGDREFTQSLKFVWWSWVEKMECRDEVLDLVHARHIFSSLSNLLDLSCFGFYVFKRVSWGSSCPLSLFISSLLQCLGWWDGFHILVAVPRYTCLAVMCALAHLGSVNYTRWSGWCWEPTLWPSSCKVNSWPLSYIPENHAHHFILTFLAQMSFKYDLTSHFLLGFFTLILFQDNLD